jgi:TonB family protein
MDRLAEVLSRIDGPTLIVAAVLALAMVLVVKIAKTLVAAGAFGALAAGVALGAGDTPAQAGARGALAFGVAALALVTIGLTRRLLVWLLISAAGVGALLLFGCGRSDTNTVRLPDQTARRGDDPPVMINPDPPVDYPPALYSRGVEGRVILRLYVDELGRLVAESTAIATSSGYPALDSAALGAAPRFRFAPALRNGTPVAASFLQPIHFRHPEAGGTTP